MEAAFKLVPLRRNMDGWMRRDDRGEQANGGEVAGGEVLQIISLSLRERCKEELEGSEWNNHYLKDEGHFTSDYYSQ